MNEKVAGDKIIEDVRSWLNHNGYVLEMEIAKQLIPICSYVEQGEQHTDPITGKLRETDIFCSWYDPNHKPGTHHALHMVIECKSTSAPWVAFFGGSINVEPGLLPYKLEGEWITCTRCEEIEHPLFDLGPGSDAPNAYAILEKKSNKSDRDLAREAALSVTSAAIANVYRSEEFVKASPVHYSLKVFSLVVTKSPLISCSLSDDGEIILSRIDSCWLQTVHEKWDSPVLVLVTTTKGFKEFAARLAEYVGTVGLK